MTARSLSMVSVRGGGPFDPLDPPEYGPPGNICPRGPDEDEHSPNGSSHTACTRGSTALPIGTICSYEGIRVEPTKDEP